jgi:inhibitor of cysteine peptidase
MKLKTIFTILLLTFALAACSPTGEEPTVTDEPTNEPTPTVGIIPGEEIPIKTITGEATVESMSILILESFPVQVHVNVTGYLGDGCTALGEISTRQEEDTFFVTIPTERPADALCTQQLVGFDESIPLDVLGLPEGTYTVNANGVTDSFRLEMDNVAEPLPGTDEEPASELDLPNEDVTDLLRLSLEHALVDQEIPDYALLADQPQIILSTENIDQSLLPSLDGVNLVTMTPEEIQAKADAEGDFPYLRFQELTAVSQSEVRVSLGSIWARAANSEIFYLSGGGFTINYTRTANGWEGEVTEMWIS